MHVDPHQTVFVGKGSDHLQLIKFWPSCAPGKGVCCRAKVFGATLLQPACSVFASLRAFFSLFTSGTSQLTINAEDQSRQRDYGEGKWYKFLGEKYILANIIAFLYSVKRRPNNIRT